jgi:protein-S-isoprenylcysteine O-methyltransferase Ste14
VRSSEASGELAVILDAIAGLISVTAILVGRGRLPVPSGLALATGPALTLVAVVWLVWAYGTLGRGLTLRVQPVSPVLIQTGPYRMVRHPVYVGLMLLVVGLAIAFRSWLGLASLILLLPTTVYRARAEEPELRARFGPEWGSYAARTGFFFPRITGQPNGSRPSAK